MPSPWSPNGILTILSLVALCIISFIVILGSDNIIDTQPVRDIVYSFPKRNLHTPRHSRAFHHHGRAPAPAPAPQASTPVVSNDQPNSPQTNPTPAQPQDPSPQPNTASPNQNTQPAKPPPSPSPSPSPSPPSQPKPQSPASSSPPSSPQAAPASSATPASSSAASPSPASAPTSVTPSSASQGASTSNIKVVSNIANYSATNYVYSYQSSLTYLDSNSGALPNPTAAKSAVISAGPTAGATSNGGFLANKGAVGVVFGIVGLVVALVLMIGGRMILRRYRNSRESREVDEFFEKYSAGGHTIDYDHHHRGASATDVAADVDAMTHAAPDAYPDRSIHYGRSGGSAHVLPPSVNIGIPYPPSAAGASIQHSVPSPGHPFAAADNGSYPTGAPPVAYPHPNYDQAQGTPFADPYYGYGTANGAAVNMGYAQ